MPLAITINLYDNNLGNYYDTTTLLSQTGIGKLTSVRTWMQGSNDYSQVTYGYDDWGNCNSEMTYDSYGTWNTAPPGGARTTTTVFDPVFHIYPISQTTPPTQYAPGGLTTSWNYDYDRNGVDDYILGLPTLETSSNGARTKADYDPFGRLTQLFRPDPVSGMEETTASLTITYLDFFPFTTTLTQKIDGQPFYAVTRVYDGLGRQTRLVSGGTITDTIYHTATETRQRIPYTTGTPPEEYTKTIVDPAARKTTVLAPDGTQTVTLTNGLVTTFTDARGNSTETTLDIWGRTARLAPPAGPAVDYTYDELNRLKTATRGGVTTTLFYDNAGRKTQMIDPDMGTWTYTYDALSNLKTQTDARGCVLSLNYDNLNRLTGKASAGSCGTQVSTSYTYDSGTNGKGTPHRHDGCLRLHFLGLRQTRADAHREQNNFLGGDLRYDVGV